MVDTETTFTNPQLTDRECSTVDNIIAAIKDIAMCRTDHPDEFTCNQDAAIQTLASLALAVIRHGALA